MRQKKGLDLHGVLLLDKPCGVTSNRVLQQVKRHLNARKAGHTGALDPLATGVLPLCFGEATKFSQFLLDADKSYQVRAQLGVQMDTADADGEVMARMPVPHFSASTLQCILDAHFRGQVMQTAPKYSALKHQGVPLYELARAGRAVPDKIRTVHLYETRVQACGEDWFELSVTCSKGTYIRSLVEDVAAALGTLGYVKSLRRVAHGPFQIAATQPLDRVLDTPPEQVQQALLPMDAGLVALPVVALNDVHLARLKHGQRLPIPMDANAGPVRLYYRGQFLGLGKPDAEGEAAPNPEGLTAPKPEGLTAPRLEGLTYRSTPPLEEQAPNPEGVTYRSTPPVEEQAPNSSAKPDAITHIKCLRLLREDLLNSISSN